MSSFLPLHSSLYGGVVGAIPYRIGQSGTPVPTNREGIPLPYILPLHYSIFALRGCRGRHPLQKRTVGDACPYNIQKERHSVALFYQCKALYIIKTQSCISSLRSIAYHQAENYARKSVVICTFGDEMHEES